MSVSPSSDNRIASGFHRPAPDALLLILPPEADADYLQAGLTILKRQLYAQLSAAGYRVAFVNQDNYATLWSQEISAVGGIYDPATGKLQHPEYAQALSALVQRVSDETKAVLVLHPRLVIREAELGGSVAMWDGQQRLLPLTSGNVANVRHSETAQGVSVELMGFTANGEFALRTYGGASIPFRFNTVTHRDETRTDLFARETELADAVALTVAPIVSKQ